jgi:hypothetical protein
MINIEGLVDIGFLKCSFKNKQVSSLSSSCSSVGNYKALTISIVLWTSLGYILLFDLSSFAI